MRFSNGWFCLQSLAGSALPKKGIEFKAFCRLKGSKVCTIMSIVSEHEGEGSGSFRRPGSGSGRTGGRLSQHLLARSAETGGCRRVGTVSKTGHRQSIDGSSGTVGFSAGDTVRLSVGLHSGYGSAQRMYIKRGYLPDGAGAYYEDAVAAPYQSYPLDDSLVLRLIKTKPTETSHFS